MSLLKIIFIHEGDCFRIPGTVSVEDGWVVNSASFIALASVGFAVIVQIDWETSYVIITN
jgi:hypothetical protein